jgi:hypothetical protein
VQTCIIAFSAGINVTTISATSFAVKSSLRGRSGESTMHDILTLTGDMSRYYRCHCLHTNTAGFDSLVKHAHTTHNSANASRYPNCGMGS